MDINVPKTDRFQIQSLLLIILFFILSGCAERETKVQVTPSQVPEITLAYLLEHRIVSHLPKQHVKIVSTLPYEIKNFDESYLLRLIAEIPDKNSSTLPKAKLPHYYLWLERRSGNWRDFDTAYSTRLETLKVDPHFSSIRQGHYYKEYTIDFSLEQLSAADDNEMELLLVNQQNQTSTITVPSLYIEAFFEMVKQASQ